MKTKEKTKKTNKQKVREELKLTPDLREKVEKRLYHMTFKNGITSMYNLEESKRLAINKLVIMYGKWFMIEFFKSYDPKYVSYLEAGELKEYKSYLKEGELK